LSTASLDQIFNLNVDPTKVWYEPLDDYDDAFFNICSRYAVPRTTKNKHPILWCSLDVDFSTIFY